MKTFIELLQLGFSNVSIMPKLSKHSQLTNKEIAEKAMNMTVQSLKQSMSIKEK